jgi:hypothetical protein
MRNRYIASAIMLFAGAITIIFNIIKEIEFLSSMKRLLLVLIIFYIIGKIAAMIILKVTKTSSLDETNKQPEEPLSEEEAENQEK